MHCFPLFVQLGVGVNLSLRGLLRRQRDCIVFLVVSEALRLSVPALVGALWADCSIRLFIYLALPSHLDVLEVLRALRLIQVDQVIVSELFLVIVGVVIVELEAAGKRQVLELH